MRKGLSLEVASFGVFFCESKTQVSFSILFCFFILFCLSLSNVLVFLAMRSLKTILTSLYTCREYVSLCHFKSKSNEKQRVSMYRSIKRWKHLSEKLALQCKFPNFILNPEHADIISGARLTAVGWIFLHAVLLLCHLLTGIICQQVT